MDKFNVFLYADNLKVSTIVSVWLSPCNAAPCSASQCSAAPYAMQPHAGAYAGFLKEGGGQLKFFGDFVYTCREATCHEQQNCEPLVRGLEACRPRKFLKMVRFEGYFQPLS